MFVVDFLNHFDNLVVWLRPVIVIFMEMDEVKIKRNINKRKQLI